MPPKEEEPQSKEEAQPVVKQARHGWFHFIDELQFWSEFYIFAYLCPVCFVYCPYWGIFPEHVVDPSSGYSIQVILNCL